MKVEVVAVYLVTAITKENPYSEFVQISMTNYANFPTGKY